MSGSEDDVPPEVKAMIAQTHLVANAAYASLGRLITTWSSMDSSINTGISRLQQMHNVPEEELSGFNDRLRLLRRLAVRTADKVQTGKIDGALNAIRNVKTTRDAIAHGHVSIGHGYPPTTVELRHRNRFFLKQIEAAREKPIKPGTQPATIFPFRMWDLTIEELDKMAASVAEAQAAIQWVVFDLTRPFRLGRLGSP